MHTYLIIIIITYNRYNIKKTIEQQEINMFKLNFSTKNLHSEIMYIFNT